MFEVRLVRLIVLTGLCLLAPTVAPARAAESWRAPKFGEEGESRSRQAGFPIPDVTLLDQDGRQLRFYSDLVRGRTVAINFIFTTCTTICPPMGANFAKLQKVLEDRDVLLISVSVDPTTDTPQRLKSWQARFGGGPGWTLLTGSVSEVQQLLKALGTYTPEKTEHAPVVLIGNDSTGNWTERHGLASPPQLLAAIDGVIG